MEGSASETNSLERYLVGMLIYRSVVKGMLEHARQAAPNECCGLLLGGRAIIEEGVRARNLTPSPNRYQIDPRDILQSFAGQGLKVVALLGRIIRTRPLLRFPLPWISSR